MKFTVQAAIVAAALSLGAAAQASTTIDFSGFNPGDSVTAPISGVTFSLSGGADGGAPSVGYVFGDTSALAISNSITVSYPTAWNLVATFSSTVSSVSFTFNNFGDTNGSTAFAYDGLGNIIASLVIDQDPFASGYGTGTLSASGIKSVAFNNGNITDGWLFGVSSLTFNGVPEPQSWAMMIAGFGLVGATMRRRRMAVA